MFFRVPKCYNVKRSTLFNHARGKDKNAPKSYKGQAFHLTYSEEMAIAQYAKVLLASGLPLRRLDITKCAVVCICKTQVM